MQEHGFGITKKRSKVVRAIWKNTISGKASGKTEGGREGGNEEGKEGEREGKGEEEEGRLKHAGKDQIRKLSSAT